MRAILLTLAVIAILTVLAAIALHKSATEPPRPPLVSDGIPSPRIRYICSITNEEAMVYITSDGDELDPMPTGNGCDYAGWLSDDGPHRKGW